MWRLQNGRPHYRNNLAHNSGWGGFGRPTSIFDWHRCRRSNARAGVRPVGRGGLVGHSIYPLASLPLCGAECYDCHSGGSSLGTAKFFRSPSADHFVGRPIYFACNRWRFGPVSGIYGAPGVILAHVFFNLPLATRFLLQGWSAVPSERFRVVQSLAASPWAYFRLIEWPLLKSVVPGAFLLVFLLCLTSFAVALAVGGGPRGTTIELAIYQAFRLDFDLGKAASLALVQFTLCGVVAVMAFLVPLPQTDGLGLGRLPQRLDASGHRGVDFMWITISAAFLILPLGAISIRGLGHIASLPHQVFTASITSVLIALASTVVCISMALGLSLAFARRGQVAQNLAEGMGILGLATSPLVVGTGIFLMIFPFAHPMTFALPITASVNAMMALPFALRVLMPAVRETYADYLTLRCSLNLTRWVWLHRILLPRLRRPLGFAAGLAAALSMGDLGVIALFADPDLQTLPLMLYRLMGAYRMDQAAAVAVVLVAQSLALFWMFDRGGRGYAGSP